MKPFIKMMLKKIFLVGVLCLLVPQTSYADSTRLQESEENRYGQLIFGNGGGFEACYDEDTEEHYIQILNIKDLDDTCTGENGSYLSKGLSIDGDFYASNTELIENKVIGTENIGIWAFGNNTDTSVTSPNWYNSYYNKFVIASPNYPTSAYLYGRDEELKFNVTVGDFGYSFLGFYENSAYFSIYSYLRDGFGLDGDITDNLIYDVFDDQVTYLQSESGSLSISSDNYGNPLLYIVPSENTTFVGIGTTTPYEALTVSGDLKISGTIEGGIGVNKYSRDSQTSICETDWATITGDIEFFPMYVSHNILILGAANYLNSTESQLRLRLYDQTGSEDTDVADSTVAVYDGSGWQRIHNLSTAWAGELGGLTSSDSGYTASLEAKCASEAEIGGENYRSSSNDQNDFGYTVSLYNQYIGSDVPVIDENNGYARDLVVLGFPIAEIGGTFTGSTIEVTDTFEATIEGGSGSGNLTYLTEDLISLRSEDLGAYIYGSGDNIVFSSSEQLLPFKFSTIEADYIYSKNVLKAAKSFDNYDDNYDYPIQIQHPTGGTYALGLNPNYSEYQVASTNLQAATFSSGGVNSFQNLVFEHGINVNNGGFVTGYVASTTEDDGQAVQDLMEPNYGVGINTDPVSGNALTVDGNIVVSGVLDVEYGYIWSSSCRTENGCNLAVDAYSANTNFLTTSVIEFQKDVVLGGTSAEDYELLILLSATLFNSWYDYVAVYVSIQKYNTTTPIYFSYPVQYAFGPHNSLYNFVNIFKLSDISAASPESNVTLEKGTYTLKMYIENKGIITSAPTSTIIDPNSYLNNLSSDSSTGYHGSNANSWSNSSSSSYTDRNNGNFQNVTGVNNYNGMHFNVTELDAVILAIPSGGN